MENLEFYIASKAPVKIITLVGTWNASASIAIDNCINEIEKNGDGEFLVIYVRDLQDILQEAYKDLIQFQVKMRANFSGGIKICSLLPSLKNTLLSSGVVRPNELTNNLKDTLTQIISSKG